MGALEDLANTPDPQPQSGGSALEALANSPDTAPQRTGLDAVANDPNNIPLDSYAHATERGIANIGQGVAQAIQSTGHAIAHPIDTAKDLGQGISQAVQHPVNTVKAAMPTDLLALGDAAGRGAGQLTAGIVAERLPFEAAKTVKSAANLVKVPEALSKDVSSTLATAAHNEGLPPLTTATARESAEELSQSFVKRAKEQYNVVDKAVGGDLKPVQERITALKKAIRIQSNVNPDLADKYIDDLAVQQKTLAGLVEKAKAAGVTNAEDLMSAGDKDYAKGMAMKDVSKGVKTASGIAKSGGHPNPTLFANQVDRLYNTGTLTRALGDDGAKAMLDTAKAGLSKLQRQQAIANIPGVKQVVKVGKGVAAIVGGDSSPAPSVKTALGGVAENTVSDSLKSALGGPTQSATKPIYEMSPPELEASHIAAKSEDSAMLQDLFGEDGAKRYNSLQRTSNGSNFEKADAASEELKKMESGLTPDQESRLYGTGKNAGPTHEDFADYKQALNQIDGATPEELGRSMKYSITKIGELRSPTQMNPSQQVAYAQLRHGFEIAEKNGWDKNQVLKTALEAASKRWEPEDAAFMLKQFMKKTPAKGPLHALAGK